MTASQPSRAVGLTHASSVMPVVRSSGVPAAPSVTVTQSSIPSNCSARPTLPGTRTAPVMTPPPPPPPPPSTSGLVLSFSFDEADGQPAIDASSSGRNGVITGAGRVPGKVGRALQFDGIDDWVTVTDGAARTPLDLTTGMTLEAWVKPTALDR